MQGGKYEKRIDFLFKHLFFFLVKSFLFFVFSFVVVFSPSFAYASSFYSLSPSSGSHRAGSTFAVDVVLRGSGDTVEGRLSFDRNIIEVQSISENRSDVAMWAPGGRPQYSNPQGTISFSGGIPGGVQGPQANIFTINFRGSREGAASVEFVSGKVFVAGEEVTLSFTNGSYTITSAPSSPPSNPAPPISTPPPPDNLPNLTFDEEEDDVFEEKLTIEVDNENDVTNPTPVFTFITDEDGLGVSYYEIYLGENFYDRIFLGEEEEKKYRIAPLLSGDYFLEVRAFDESGDYISAFVDFSIEPILLEIEETSTIFKKDEKVKISGETLPDSTVRFYFEKREDSSLPEERDLFRGDEKREDVTLKEVLSGGEGKFVFEEFLEEGEYMVYVQAKDQREAQSEVINFHLEVTEEQDEWIIFLMGLIFFLIILGFFLIFFFRRKIKKEEKKREEKEEVSLGKEDAHMTLQKKVEEQIAYLEKKIDLSRSETIILKELKSALEDPFVKTISKKYDNR